MVAICQTGPLLAVDIARGEPLAEISLSNMSED